MFGNIVWSDESCTLKTFVERFAFPQLVKVEEGIYSEDDDTTLSAEEVLMLHSAKGTEKLLIEDAKRKQYLVPLNYPSTVEILPKSCQDRYDSVEDVVDDWTSADFKFIRVVEVSSRSPSLRIRAGNVLKLKKVVEENNENFLECMFYGATEYLVKIPFDIKAAFAPLARREPYHLQDILGSFKLPLRVKFLPPDTTTQDVNNNIDVQSLGSVLIKELRQKTTAIIATSRDIDGDMVPDTVFTIPIDLDVNVFPAHEDVVRDEHYVKFCKDLHDRTELTNIDQNGNGLKYIEESTVDVVHDYKEVERKLSENFDSSHHYEDVDSPPTTTPPPPLPSKPKPKPRPGLAPTFESELIDDVSEVSNAERPSNIEEASPHKSLDDSIDNVDDDDEDPYLSSECDSDENYVFYEPVYPEQTKSSRDRMNQSPRQYTEEDEYVSISRKEHPSIATAEDEAPPPVPRRLESLGQYTWQGKLFNE